MDVASLSPWLPSQAGALSITIRPHGLLMHILVAFSGIGVGVGVEITPTETKVTGSIASPSIKKASHKFSVSVAATFSLDIRLFFTSFISSCQASFVNFSKLANGISVSIPNYLHRNQAINVTLKLCVSSVSETKKKCQVSPEASR